MKKVRAIRVEGGLGYVPLTKGYEAIVDAEDIPLIQGYNWYAAENKNTVYAVRKERGEDGHWRTLRMHTVIVESGFGPHTDHRNHNGLDNRKSNLRACTPTANVWNRPKQANNTSGYKGVTWNKQKHKWIASISIEGKNKYIGQFDAPEEAHQAYQKMCREIRGDYGFTGAREN